MGSPVEYVREPPVATLWLNRPQARNAFDLPMLRSLRRGVGEAERDPQVRAIVVRGRGDAFCVGADLSLLDDVIALCETLGQELAESGVTCNAVSPGPTNTRLLHRWREEHPEQAEKLRRRIPAGHFGEPDDVAALVGFLCSDRAGYLNGQVISVNGGLHSP